LVVLTVSGLEESETPVTLNTWTAEIVEVVVVGKDKEFGDAHTNGVVEGAMYTYPLPVLKPEVTVEHERTFAPPTNDEPPPPPPR
jgi:hypothetical protein